MHASSCEALSVAPFAGLHSYTGRMLHMAFQYTVSSPNGFSEMVCKSARRSAGDPTGHSMIGSPYTAMPYSQNPDASARVSPRQ